MGSLISLRRRNRTVALCLFVFALISISCIPDHRPFLQPLDRAYDFFRSSIWATTDDKGKLARLFASSRTSRWDSNHHPAHLRFGIGVKDDSRARLVVHGVDGETTVNTAHEYNANTGFLTVNPEGPHPIFNLTACAFLSTPLLVH